MEKFDQLVEKLSRDATAMKPASHPFMLSLKWMGVAVAYVLILLAITGARPDLMKKLHEPWYVAEIVVLLGIFITTALSAAVLSFPDMHQKHRTAFAPIWMLVLFLLVLFNAWSADNPPIPLPKQSFECTLNIMLFSFLPTVAIFYVLRKFASTHQRWSGGIAMLFAFSIGALWMRLYEMNDSIAHIIEWHYLPMIGVGLVGLWLGKALLKW